MKLIFHHQSLIAFCISNLISASSLFLILNIHASWLITSWLSIYNSISVAFNSIHLSIQCKAHKYSAWLLVLIHRALYLFSIGLSSQSIIYTPIQALPGFHLAHQSVYIFSFKVFKIIINLSCSQLNSRFLRFLWWYLLDGLCYIWV